MNTINGSMKTNWIGSFIRKFVYFSILMTFAARASAAEFMVLSGQGLMSGKITDDSGEIELSPAGYEKGGAWFTVTEDARRMFVVGGERIAVLDRQDDGTWKEAAQADTFGGTPCYVEVSPNGRTVWVANFREDPQDRPSRGSIVEFSVAEDGSLEKIRKIQHQGSGKVSPRQDNSHPHSIEVCPLGKYAAIGDLGIDRAVVYGLESASQRIDPATRIDFFAGDGTGPRHIAFDSRPGETSDPYHPIIYVNTEMSAEVVAFQIREEGASELIRVSSRSEQPGGNSPSDIATYRLNDDVNMIYSANRGSDTIAVIKHDKKAGSMELIETVSKEGKNVRSLAVGERWLLCANQGSGSLSVFAIQEDGRLVHKFTKEGVPQPSCVQFIPGAN